MNQEFMSDFKQIGIFMIKLLVLFVFILVLLLNISPQYMGNYEAALIDKANRSKSINEPKIVLIGNSNLAFGIDSEEIEKTFNMPVVNMGLHGGLGNVFHERMSLFNVNEGDIYIICHSAYDDDGKITNMELAWITIETHWDLWKLLRCQDVKPMLEKYPVYLKKCISLWLENKGNIDGGGVYDRSAFNEYGDIEWDDNGEIFDFGEYQSIVPTISDEVAKRINNLRKYLNSKGAVLLLAGYPIADTDDRSSNKEFIDFQEKLKELIDAPVISDYTDYIYPRDYFYNAVLHLNNVGKKARTNQLIEDIKVYLEKD